jgi:hypothetical protein
MNTSPLRYGKLQQLNLMEKNLVEQIDDCFWRLNAVGREGAACAP